MRVCLEIKALQEACLGILVIDSRMCFYDFESMGRIKL